MRNSPRCCNLDWLEVYCFEPIDEPHNADYFRAQGLQVSERSYGTRVYREMFVIFDSWGQPAIEVRRNPVSGESESGVLPINATHLRLTNRACYYDNAGQFLLNFIDTYNYTFQRIARVDVCLDFIRFDSLDYPAKFIRRYLEGKYRKINQGRIHVHGDDTWQGQTYNSVSWGSKTSQVSTKLYNKSQELREVHNKPYIKQAWFECGLVHHPIDCYVKDRKGNLHYPDVWRLEFSISSSVKGWYRIEEDGKAKHIHSFRNTLEEWNTREKCLTKFLSLVPHYFRFKYYEANVRKDRCLDKALFAPQPAEFVYHIERIASADRQQPLTVRLRKLLDEYRLKKYDEELRSSIDVILRALGDDAIIESMPSPFTRADLLTMRAIISAHPNGRNLDYATVLRQIHELLMIPEDAPFWE